MRLSEPGSEYRLQSVMSETSRLSNDSVLLPTLIRHRQKGSTLDIFQIKPTCLPRHSHSPFPYNNLGHAWSLFIQHLGHAWSLFRSSLDPKRFSIIISMPNSPPPKNRYWPPFSASKFQPILAKLRKEPISDYTNSLMQPSFILIPRITSKCHKRFNSL